MYCISVSHKKAPVNIRAKLAFGAEEKTEFIKGMMEKKKISGVVVLCTCNRTEIYASGTGNIIREIQRAMSEFKKVRLENFIRYLNVYSGESAIRHLFKVCSGFDSMVLGEDEILGQVKTAYQISKERKAADYEINVLFQKAITCAKRIKTDTKLSSTPLSIATLVANEVFHFKKEGEDKKVMVIGMTGKMGNTIIKNILSKPGIQITGTVRSHKKVLNIEVNDKRISVVDYKDRYRYMNEMDIVISATLSPHYTVTVEELKEHASSRRNRLFMDVAVPVDMDPEISKIEGTTFYDIDYFETLSKNNTEIKLKELDRAKSIMEEELDTSIKEMMFHPYIQKMDDLKKVFTGKRLDTMLYQIRDHVTSEELKVVLKTLDSMEDWIKEE